MGWRRGYSTVVPPVLNPTSTDTDGDGMPNTWETTHFLNPADSSDATSDFDCDGLTALQEFQLHQTTAGQYGKPEGTWSASPLPVIPGFSGRPEVTLIECATNGIILVSVQGKYNGATTYTTWPHTWSPATGVWTRIAAPTGYTVTSLTPLDVNASGRVVGYFNSSGTKGFVWTPGSPGGGTTDVFTLPASGGATIPAIPRRISDAGYLVGDANTLGGRSFAGTLGNSSGGTNLGTEITFPDLGSGATYFDVNNYGEFVGSITDPYYGQFINSIGATQKLTFLATPGRPVFFTGVAADDLDMPGNLTHVPDIDPGNIYWTGTDSHGFQFGFGIDRLTSQSVPVHKGYYAEFYWGANVGLSTELWYAMGFTPVLGAVNDWGEFAGSYSSTLYTTHFSGPAPYGQVSGGIANGVSFYGGSYHYTRSKPAIYGLSNQPVVLIGTPFALWSGPVVVPLGNLMPAGYATGFTAARIADHGRVVLQRGSPNPIHVLQPAQDSDGDGMPDDWEAYYGLNPNFASDAWADLDGDGVSNHAEFRYRTNPSLATLPNGQTLDIRPGIDSDGDGLPNVWEWKHGLNASRASDAEEDSDGDGLTNLQEFHLGTHPKIDDTDGDGVADGREVNVLFSNPLSAIDSDGDGIPNDFEKWWAGRVIASGIGLTIYQRSQLEAGNIDPGGDAFGDGNINAEQFKVSRDAIASGDSYRTRGQVRGVWGTLGASEGGNYGGIAGLAYAQVRWIGSPSVEPYYPPSGWTTPSPSEIDQELIVRSPWGLLGWEDYSYMQTEAYLNQETFAGSFAHTRMVFLNFHQRYKLVYPDISSEARTVNFLKVTTTWGYPVAGIPIQTFKTVQLTVPANRTSSQVIEVMPTFALGKNTIVSLHPVEIKAFKRGTLNSPGAEVPAGTGEFGYETVMMENADSESSVTSTSRDCDESGVSADLNAHRKANDDDLVKIVLKWPAGIKPAGVSLKLLNVGMQVDGRQTTSDAAVRTSGSSRLNFYKADGTRIINPTTELQIADLANAPASSYLSKILTDGEVTIFIEGADRFGDLPNDPALLGGAQLKWEFSQGGATTTAKLAIYRGGFLRFMQPTGAPGTVGDFEFWDGKGRVKHKIGKPIFGKEFGTDVTDYGIKLTTWKAKSGKTIDNPEISGKSYNVNDGFGHTPPGWWETKRRTDFTGAQPDKISGAGLNKKIKQGGYVRWKQDDETVAADRYTTPYRYDASNAHDAAIGEPTTIRFKFDMTAIAPGTAQGRTDIQIHPDGECTDNIMGGTAGCIGIQTYKDCLQVDGVLRRFHGLKVKVQLTN